MAGIELTGSIGPTFFLLLAAAGIGLYIAAKYRTNEALKGAAEGWQLNAEAQKERADKLDTDLSAVRVDLASVRAELVELQKRAPDLRALYELNNHAAVVNKNNESTLKVIVTQLERLVQGIDTFAQHAAKQT